MPCVKLDMNLDFCEISQLHDFPDSGSVLSDADTGSQCGQSDALSSLPPGEQLSFKFSFHWVVFTLLFKRTVLAFTYALPKLHFRC